MFRFIRCAFYVNNDDMTSNKNDDMTVEKSFPTRNSLRIRVFLSFTSVGNTISQKSQKGSVGVGNETEFGTIEDGKKHFHLAAGITGFIVIGCLPFLAKHCLLLSCFTLWMTARKGQKQHVIVERYKCHQS